MLTHTFISVIAMTQDVKCSCISWGHDDVVVAIVVAAIVIVNFAYICCPNAAVAAKIAPPILGTY